MSIWSQHQVYWWLWCFCPSSPTPTCLTKFVKIHATIGAHMLYVITLFWSLSAKQLSLKACCCWNLCLFVLHCNIQDCCKMVLVDLVCTKIVIMPSMVWYFIMFTFKPSTLTEIQHSCRIVMVVRQNRIPKFSSWSVGFYKVSLSLFSLSVFS